MNQGNGSGQAIGCVSWDGQVHPDQFWRQHVLGNVLERPFSRNLVRPGHPAAGGPARPQEPAGRALRAVPLAGRVQRQPPRRAEAVSGECWADDPACYLSDDEIAPADPA